LVVGDFYNQIFGLLLLPLSAHFLSALVNRIDITKLSSSGELDFLFVEMLEQKFKIGKYVSRR